jgi:hypothetical protein
MSNQNRKRLSKREREREAVFRRRLASWLLEEMGIDVSADTEEGRMAALALDAYLDFRRDVARERAAEVAAWQRSRHRPLNQHPGPGFRFEGHGHHRRVVPDPAQRAIMGRIVDWYEAGETVKAISRRLNEEDPENCWYPKRLYRAIDAEWRLRALEARDRSPAP